MIGYKRRVDSIRNVAAFSPLDSNITFFSNSFCWYDLKVLPIKLHEKINI